MGQRLLKKVEVQEKINELQQLQSKRTEITADMVLAELAAIAFSDRTELAKVDSNGSVQFTPTDKLSDDVKKTISGIKEGKFGTEVSSYDKVKALELIGKHLGMFSEKKDNRDTHVDKELPQLYNALMEDTENDVH